MPISPYLKALRSQIGHDPIFLPAVGALIFDEAGRLLLHRSADDGRWHTIGGSMEPEEQPAQALIREVQEETGLIVEPEYITEIYTRTPTVYSNGDVCVYLAIFFKCKITGGELRIGDDESLELKFYLPDELPELSEEDLATIERARNRGQIAYFE